MEEFDDAVRKQLRAQGLSQRDAEDAVQTAWAKYFTQKNLYDPERNDANFPGWFVKVALNGHADDQRKKHEWLRRPRGGGDSSYRSSSALGVRTMSIEEKEIEGIQASPYSGPDSEVIEAFRFIEIFFIGMKTIKRLQEQNKRIAAALYFFHACAESVDPTSIAHLVGLSNRADLPANQFWANLLLKYFPEIGEFVENRGLVSIMSFERKDDLYYTVGIWFGARPGTVDSWLTPFRKEIRGESIKPTG